MDLTEQIRTEEDALEQEAVISTEFGRDRIEHKRFENGIVTYWSQERDLQAFCDALVEASRAEKFSGIFLFYPQTWCDPGILSETAKQIDSGTDFVGCSSAGAVTPAGLEDDPTLVALMLPARYFTVASTVLEKLGTLGMNDIVARVRSLKTRLSVETASNNFNDVFAVSLIDGLSYSEEAVTAALHRGLDGLPLVGGSAGDDLRFSDTSQFYNGTVYSQSTVLLLIKCKIPFRTFTNNNFIPTEHKLVVTDSDPDLRKVIEFNARPAAIEYANTVGLDPASLTPDSFASHPVVVRVGGEYYCRSIQKCEDDHSLSFFCAIDNGIVLTIAKPTGMLKSTRNAIERLRSSLGAIDMILGFDCILRRLDAQNRGNVEEISALYSEANVVGFGTYGEQFNSMHINQTFTGVAFGRAPANT